ncbi:hypothetical protein FXO38_24642 [Capsicum annuum]|nr:hypothetical protein FXO37_30743 [Capsicum annuum]KAF3635411.1 hypothetical protein FXO38_24642 [Capsicum annuum]
MVGLAIVVWYLSCAQNHVERVLLTVVVLLDGVCGIFGGVGICVFCGGVGGLDVGIGGIGGGFGGIGYGGGGPSIMSPKRKETESGENTSISYHQTKKAKVQIDSEKLPEQSQSGQNEVEESDNSSTPIGREIISKSQYDSVKTISIDKFRVVMLMNSPNTVFVILIEYEGREGGKKMDEVLINYYGMLVYFGLKDFAIVTGLRCDRPEEPLIKEIPHKGSNKRKVKKDELLCIVGLIYKGEDFMVDLKNKNIPKLCKEKLLGHVKPFRPSESSLGFTRMRFPIQGFLDLCASSGGLSGGVVYDGGSHPDATASYDYEYVGAQQKINTFENTSCTGPPSHPYIGPSHSYSGPSHPSSPSCSYCKCKVCKDGEKKLLEKLEAIAEASKELKSRRGVIASNKVRELCTRTVVVRRMRRKIRQILSVLKLAKIATPPAPRVVEV